MSSSSDLRSILDIFSNQPAVPGDARQHLETAIASSPMLTAFISAAARRDPEHGRALIERIELSPASTNAAGHYNASSRSLHINESSFLLVQQGLIEDKVFHDGLVATLGHETSHAFDAEHLRQATWDLNKAITDGMRVAGSGGHVDLTEAIGRYIATARSGEATAEIAGINVLVSRVFTETGGTLDADNLIARIAPTTECVTRSGGKFMLADGLTLAANGRIGSEQREAVARCHFDEGQHGLGQTGNASYRNYYAAYAIERIEETSRGWADPPTVILRMDQLGLDKRQIQDSGLDFQRAGRTISIIDPASGAISFQHNATGRSLELPDRRHVGNLEGMSTSPERTPPLSERVHPLHGLYLQVAQATRNELPAGAAVSEDRLAQFTAMAHGAGIRQGKIEIDIKGSLVTLRGEHALSATIDLERQIPTAQESATHALQIQSEQAAPLHMQSTAAYHDAPALHR